MMSATSPLRFAGALLVLLLVCCTNEAEHSAKRAVEHVEYLVQVSERDVAEVRQGLPKGAKRLVALWKDGENPADDPERVRDQLQHARFKVQDLRIAKSTFFAVARADGEVLRSDQEQDLMVGKNILDAYPSLKPALRKGYAETVGSMHEARGVEGKPDGQWVAASAIEVGGEVRGLYVTGWSWAHYARRLHEGLSSHIHDAEEGKKPLIYIFMLIGKKAYGRREAPVVNAEAIEKLDPLSQTQGEQVFRTELEITGRDFGLAAKRAPALGEDIAIAVLRSEI